MTRLSRRGPWLPEEDSALVELVRTQGPNNWVRISQQLQHRSPKQCRERYHQNLKPSLNHEPISTQEGEMIEQLVNEMGKRWAEIARRLGNRSDNAVKNWWNGSMNRRKRNPSQNSTSKIIGNRINPMSCVKPHKAEYDIHSRHINRHQQPADYHVSGRWLSPESSFLNNRTLKSPLPKPEQHFESYEPSAASVQLGNTNAQDSREISERGTPYFYSQQQHATEPSRLPPLRLPPINYSQPENFHSSTLPQGRSITSPAISEFSHTYSTRPVPSLISDSQSTCSISPKTITSPRLSAPPLLGYGDRQCFPDTHGKYDQLPFLPLRAGSTTEPQQARSRAMDDLLFRTNKNLKSSSCQPFGNILSPMNEPLKDTRMHVSSLVQ